MSYLVNLLIFTAISCAVFGVASLVPTQAGLAPVGPGLSVRRNSSSFSRYFAGFGGKFLPTKEKDRTELRLIMLQADFDDPQAAETYYGIRVSAALGLAALVFVVLPLLFFLSMVKLLGIALFVTMVGFMVPMYYVKGRQKKNQEIVRLGLPDVLDLLLVCSEAGLGLDMAIARVGVELALTQPLLSKHLLQIGSELRAGRTRADALRGFADRTGTAETNSLTRLLVQSEAHGTSITTTLRIFSDEMRSHRMLRAEEAAQKMGAKLSMVLIFSFMPAIFIAVGAPVVSKLITGLKAIPHL
jgi:tight adherence protein C